MLLLSGPSVSHSVPTVEFAIRMLNSFYNLFVRVRLPPFALHIPVTLPVSFVNQFFVRALQKFIRNFAIE